MAEVRKRERQREKFFALLQYTHDEERKRHDANPSVYDVTNTRAAGNFVSCNLMPSSFVTF